MACWLGLNEKYSIYEDSSKCVNKFVGDNPPQSKKKKLMATLMEGWVKSPHNRFWVSQQSRRTRSTGGPASVYPRLHNSLIMIPLPHAHTLFSTIIISQGQS